MIKHYSFLIQHLKVLLMLSGANPEIIEVDARYCSIKPTILLNCMRKQMTLFRKSTRACNVQMTNLRSLNVMKLG
ncbi:hypothetical protein B566_EDAN003607 [Ephemera danica]|nr:hypothetical protein B566_EDAN003607 [Ephemera danica]